MKPSYKWDKNSASNFKIEEFYSSIESNNADVISQKLYNIFHTVCKNSLKKIKPVKSRKKNAKKNDKLWYDKDVIKKRNEIKNISKGKSSNPPNRELKLICQQKRQIFWSNKNNQLGETNSSEDGDPFWSNWKQFSENRIRNNTEIQDGNKCENYYKNLYMEKKVTKYYQLRFKNQIRN